MRGKIALFCKFWTEGWLVRFADVCNVRWLPQLTRRAEAGGQKLFFSCTNLQSMSHYFLSVFSNFIIRFQCSILSLSLAANGLVYEALGISTLKIFNLVLIFITCTNFTLTTSCPMIYTLCWRYVLLKSVLFFS